MQTGSEAALAEALIAELRNGDRRSLSELIVNRLEPAAAELSPSVRAIRSELEKRDCVAAQMSGSGTACFGICRVPATLGDWLARCARLVTSKYLPQVRFEGDASAMQRPNFCRIYAVCGGPTLRFAKQWPTVARFHEENGCGNHRGADQADGGKR